MFWSSCLLSSGPMGDEMNRMNLESIFIEFFELFFTFPINRIINFRIELNESSIWKNLTPPIYVVGVELNQTNFELIFIQFFKYFRHFRINRIANFWIELNKFQFDSNCMGASVGPYKRSNQSKTEKRVDKEACT